VWKAKLNPARPAQAAEESWVVATDLAEAAGARRDSVSSGPQDSGAAGAESVRTGRSLRIGTRKSLQAFAPEFTPECAAVLNPAKGLKIARDQGRHGAAASAAALAEARRVWHYYADE